MSQENTSPEGTTQAPAQTPPATPTPSTSVFGHDESTPNWVKEAGIVDAHNAAKPPGQQPAATPPTQTPPAAAPAATPPVVPPPQTPPAAAAPAPGGSIDPKVLAQAIRDGLAPAPAGPSETELAQQLGIVTVTPEVYKSILGVDAQPDQVKALNDYGQGIAKQAVTIASVLFGQQLKQLRAEFMPYQETVRTQEAERIKNDFYTKNTDLKGYEAIVTEQYQLAKASGKTFANVQEAAKFVADQTRSRLTSLGIKLPAVGAPTNGSTNTPAKPAPARAMTPTMVGGKGGGSGQPTSPKTTHEAVWGS